MEEELEQLIIGSSFDELSPKDREYVLSLISETDYNTYHALLPKIISHFAGEQHSLSPSPEIIQQLKNKFRERPRKPFAMPALFDPVNFHFPGYRLILLVLIIFFIWFPIELSNRIKQERALQRTVNVGKAYVPQHNNLALNHVGSAPKSVTSKIWLQKDSPVYSMILRSRSHKDMGATDKYPCYDLAIPINHSDKNKAILKNSNSPGLHANLLIPDSHP